MPKKNNIKTKKSNPNPNSKSKSNPNSKYNSKKLNIPCFGVLGKLIENFSQIIKRTATHIPSAQYTLNDEYYKKVEAIQFLSLIHI